MPGIVGPDGNPYMTEEEMKAIENQCSLSSVLPWGGKYPPGVALVQRDGLNVVGPDGTHYADLHQRILSFSAGKHAAEINQAIEAARNRFSNLCLVDTTEYFEPATLLMQALHDALKPYGDYLIQLATTGTGANDQAIRLAMGSLGGPDNIQLLVLDNNYPGAGLYTNSICKAAGWTGDTSLPSPALVLYLDGSNIDEIFATCKKNGKIPILIMEDGVQGVGGFNVLDEKLLRSLTETVHDAGGRTIHDNVQSFVRATGGNGLFGFNRWADPNEPRHLPDLITFAKGIGDGHAIAGVAVLKSVAEQCKTSKRGPGNTFDTFNRGRDSLVAAKTVLEIAQRERLDKNVHAMGERFRRNLLDIVGNASGVVRGFVGMGGMTGLEFTNPDMLTRAMNQAPRSGIVVAKGGSPTYPVMRLPLQFDTDQNFVDEAASRVEDILKKVRAQTAA